MESTNQPYRFPEVQPSQPLVNSEPTYARRREPELAASRVLLHLFLLGLTALCTTLTGAAPSAPVREEPTSIIGFLFSPLVAVINETAAGNLEPLANGAVFTFTLLLILAAHEFGHYFACRHYKVRATLPFFIPAPPVITLFGTFGAVIRIKEPIRSRKALFDIGVAGPLAGFALALPASVIGLLVARAAPPITTPGVLAFHDPPLLMILMRLLGTPEWIDMNPVIWAAWGTLLVTALNLFPVGQLDGGHVLYAVAGPRIHKWVSRITCAALATLAVVSMIFYSSPVWILWTLVLLFLLKAGHPPVVDTEPLGPLRVTLAVIAALVFLLCFMPFPISVS